MSPKELKNVTGGSWTYMLCECCWWVPLLEAPFCTTAVDNECVMLLGGKCKE